MKIAVNSRMLLERGTGVPNYVNYLYQACLKLDKSNQYIFFQPSKVRTIGETYLASSPSGLVGAAWFDTFQAGRLTRSQRPDIFHGPSHILPFRKERGIKYVVTVHDLAFRIFPEHYGLKHRAYYHLQVGRSLRMADMVLADSYNTKQDVVNLYRIPKELVEVVHLGVAEQFLKSAEMQKQRVVPERYFLSITTHPKRKNVLGALKAFATFASRTDAKYVVAGLMGEPQKQEFLSLANELGLSNKVILYGYADDNSLVSLYQNAEFLLYPSFYEGFGLPVVEAMACGCPVIAANSSSIPEIVPSNEWLVNPLDIMDIAEKMQRLMGLTKEARQQLVQKCQAHASHFTWEAAASKMIRIYNSIGNSPSK